MKSRRNPGSTIEAPMQNEIVPELEKAISLRAYELFQQRGEQHGHDLDDWLRAETELTTGQAKRDAA